MSYWSLLEPLMCDQMWIWTRSGGICIIIMAKRIGSAQRWQQHLSLLHLHLSGNEFFNVIFPLYRGQIRFQIHITHIWVCSKPQNCVLIPSTERSHLAKFIQTNVCFWRWQCPNFTKFGTHAHQDDIRLHTKFEQFPSISGAITKIIWKL